MKIVVMTFTSLLLLTLSISACVSPDTPTYSELSVGGMIVCEVFYRPSSGMDLDVAPLITFTNGNDQKLLEFGKMSFEARFQDNDFEGRTLNIIVTNSEDEVEIFRQLFQFDLNNPVENQFIGGHGFTGLNYIFSPVSTAEIQYFCSLQ